MANELFLLYDADKATHKCDNHVSLAHFVKARLCFEQAIYLNAWGQIIGLMASFCASIIFVFSYFSTPPKRYTRSLTRCLQAFFVALKLQFEGATYINAWGKEYVEYRTLPLVNLLQYQISSSNRNVERKDVSDTMPVHSC